MPSVELQSQTQRRELAHAEWLALTASIASWPFATPRRFQIRLRGAKLRHGQAAIRGRRLPNAATPRQGTLPATRGPANGSPSIAICSSPARAASASRGCLARSPRRPAATAITVLYARVPRLFADLELAHGDGRFTRLFRTLVKADLLIFDDWGPDRLTATSAAI